MYRLHKSERHTAYGGLNELTMSKIKLRGQRDKYNVCGCVECEGRPVRTQGGADSGDRLEPHMNTT